MRAESSFGVRTAVRRAEVLRNTHDDTSRNRSAQWCSMRICGNRTKGEAFRRRRADSRA
jgi:predicted RNA-binding Zn ribbon-like protein